MSHSAPAPISPVTSLGSSLPQFAAVILQSDGSRRAKLSSSTDLVMRVTEMPLNPKLPRQAGNLLMAADHDRAGQRPPSIP
jgi:hypothetical protein